MRRPKFLGKGFKMRSFTKLIALGIIILLVACSPTGGVDRNAGTYKVGGGTAANASTSQGGVSGSGGITGLLGSVNLGGNSGTTESKACGAAAVCTSTSCGSIIDECGALIECGYQNCAQKLCSDRNECIACTPLTTSDCGTDAAQGKNCGLISDNCSSTIDCGDCPDSTQCCGCGGKPSVCGTSATGLPGNSGLTVTCNAGSKGCLCDDAGGCASGLTCTPQTDPRPSLCCDSTGCAGSTTSIGGTCTGTGGATCTPGVTVPAATSGFDSCGYASSTFNESTILCGIYATGGGKDPAQIQAFFNDEKSLTLGCTTATNPVSAMPSTGNTGAVRYPQTGDPTCNDTFGRPMRPTLYITDITFDPNCKTGDLQSSGTSYDPIAIFGTWKAATGNTPGPDPKGGMNYWTLGAGSDPVPASVTAQCPCSGPGKLCPGSGRTGKGYSTEVKYEAGLISGHSYRLQIVGHDGDQGQGGDSGEACVIFCAGSGSCEPMTCADYPAGTCDTQTDGCGALIDCGPCICIKKTCNDYPNTVEGYKSDGCGGQTEYCYPRP